MKHYLILIFLFSLVTNACLAEDISYRKVLESGLEYLRHSQVKVDNYPSKLKGEWKSLMMNDGSVGLLGKAGKSAWDSNCFTTSSIYLVLASIYQSNPQYSFLTNTLEMAIDNVLEFERNGAFGFWLLLPRNETLYPENRRDNLPLVRRPNNYVLDNSFANNGANIPEDADDTAVAYRALIEHNKLASQVEGMTERKLPDDEFYYKFSEYRDAKRTRMHFFNILQGQNIMTGAYLTWLYDETKSGVLPTDNNNTDNYYVPFGVNEVDCIVNSNILNVLATMNQKNERGFKNSCSFINKSIRKKQYDICGVYYPNHYNLHYVAAKALNAGADCLERSRPLLVQHLLGTQLPDGSYISTNDDNVRTRIISHINKRDLVGRLGDLFRNPHTPKDPGNYDSEWLKSVDPLERLQSTAYAVSALVKLVSPKDSSAISAIARSINFLIKNSSKDSLNNHYWKGGIFFSGGAIIREDITWRSDAYTTAIILESINDYLTLIAP